MKDEEISAQLARLDANLQNVLERVQSIGLSLNSHNERISKLEKITEKLCDVDDRITSIEKEIYDLNIFKNRAYWTFSIVTVILAFLTKVKGLW